MPNGNDPVLTPELLYNVTGSAYQAGERDVLEAVSLQSGIIANERGDKAQARQSFEQGIEFATKEPKNIRRAAEMNYYYGDHFLKDGQYKEASQHFDQTLAMAKEGLANPDIDPKLKQQLTKVSADATWAEGDILRREGKFKESRTKFEEAKPLFEVAQFPKGVANSDFSIGQSYLEQGNTKQSAPVLMQALQEYQAIGYNLGIAQAMKAVADSLNKDYQKSTQHERRWDNDWNQGIQEWYKNAGSYYEVIGDRK